MNKNIDLSSLLKLLKENLVLLIVTTILLGVLSFLVSHYLITPKYEATSQVIVNNNKINSKESLYTNPNEVQTNIQLIKTYSELISSDDIKKEAIDNLKISKQDKNNQLMNSISVESEENSQIIKIRVKDKNPQIAVSLANNMATASKQKIQKVMGIDNLSIFSKADTSQVKNPASPNTTLNTLLGLIFGLLLGLLIILIKFSSDNKINSEEKVEALLSLPVIGKINDWDGK